MIKSPPMNKILTTAFVAVSMMSPNLLAAEEAAVPATTSEAAVEEQLVDNVVMEWQADRLAKHENKATGEQIAKLKTELLKPQAKAFLTGSAWPEYSDEQKATLQMDFVDGIYDYVVR